MKNKGFTLVETLVAVAIIALSVAAPLYIAWQALSTAQLARQKLTASYLAQEGIEYVRMMRDDAVLQDSAPKNRGLLAFAAGTGWPSVLECSNHSQNYPNASCLLDVSVGNHDAVSNDLTFSDREQLIQCPPSECTRYPLYLFDDKYTQNPAAGVQQPYVRTIHVDLSGLEATVTSTVTWTFHGNQSITIKDHLTLWQ